MKKILIIALLILGIFNVPVFGMVAYVEVIDQETGEVVVEEEFEEETATTIDQASSYIVQIYSGNTIMTGEFEVE